MQVSLSLVGNAGAAGIRRPSGADWTARLSTDQGQKFLNVLADKTGVSAADLTKQLEGGADVAQILKDNGVSQSDFRAALKAAGVQAPQGGAHHAHHAKGAHPSGGDPDGDGDNDSVKSTVMKAITDKLGMTQSDLQSQLRTGGSLLAIAQQKGLTENDLAQVIVQAMQQGYGANGAPSSATPPPPMQLDASA